MEGPVSPTTDLMALKEKIERESAFVETLNQEVGKVIIGQKNMLERLLLALLSNGHILLEGVPGLAKTLAIKTLSEAVNAGFSRIQFTPDLLPARFNRYDDIQSGQTRIYGKKRTGIFQFYFGR